MHCVASGRFSGHTRRAGLGALTGAFYALIVAGRVRRWGWFTALAIATIISSIAGVLQAQPTILLDILGQQLAHDIGSAPGYVLISSIATSLSLLLQLLFALLSGHPSATYRPLAVASSDAVTLPCAQSRIRPLRRATICWLHRTAAERSRRHGAVRSAESTAAGAKTGQWRSGSRWGSSAYRRAAKRPGRAYFTHSRSGH